jgi:uncharacterized short protein YbdD (DUF466 family)
VILHYGIARGNPTDKTELVSLVRQTKKILKQAPRELATDRGYYSADKELHQQREALLKRKVALHKNARAGAKILPIPTRLINEYVQHMQKRLRAKKIGYKKEFFREVLMEARVKGNAVRLTY